MRRIVAVVSLVLGIGLVVVVPSYSFFARASGGDRISERLRTTMSSAGIVQLQANFQTIKGLGSQFIDQAAPAFARDIPGASVVRDWAGHTAHDRRGDSVGGRASTGVALIAVAARRAPPPPADGPIP